MSKRQFGYIAAAITVPAVIAISNAEGWKLQSAVAIAFILVIDAMAARTYAIGRSIDARLAAT